MIGINQSNLVQLAPADLDRVCGCIAEYGFRSVRFAVDWGALSNFLGSVNYGPVERVATALAKAGLEALPVLGIHYPFIHSPAAFGKFTTRVVQIFGAPAYEVWNEPNLWAFSIGSPASYLAYLRAAAPIIRASGAKVISAGLAVTIDRQLLWMRQYSPTTWLQAMYDAGESNDYDVFGYHPYALTADEKFADPATAPYGISIMTAMDKLRATHNDTRPYAYTEVGFDTNKIPTATAAQWLPQQSATLVGDQWLFCWRDTTGDGGNYGLVDATDKPKTVLYDAVKPLLNT